METAWKGVTSACNCSDGLEEGVGIFSEALFWLFFDGEFAGGASESSPRSDPDSAGVEVVVSAPGISERCVIGCWRRLIAWEVVISSVRFCFRPR